MPRTVEAINHDEAKRKNIPTAEYQSVLEKQKLAPIQVKYPRAELGSALDEEKGARNRDLEPQLVWRGEDKRDWSDLVVHAPPLYIQEKVHAKALVDDLLRQTREAGQSVFQPSRYHSWMALSEMSQPDSGATRFLATPSTEGR